MPVVITYRPAQLSYESFRTVDSECFPGEPMDEATFAAFRSGEFWAASDDGQLVGYCSLQLKGDFGWLNRLCLAAKYRRRGIGRSMMQAAVGKCEEHRIPEMILYVDSTNQPAICLYESFGFRAMETTCQYVVRADRVREYAALPGRAVLVVTIDQVAGASLPAFPRQWADIRALHSPPRQYVLVFLDQGAHSLGFCRLTPSFPGCFPFEIAEPAQNLWQALASLHPYLLPEKDQLRLTFAGERMADACEREGLTLHYRLFKMVRRP